jgi:MoaA/NifB/PqqE/SkfB family radical SAM enzyme
MALFSRYASPQREILRRLYRTRAWQEVRSDPQALEAARSGMRRPPASPSQSQGTAQYLRERNTAAARSAALRDDADADRVLAALADWRRPLAEDPAFPFHFLGLVLTLDCSFEPRCLYCNQAHLPTRMSMADWRRILAEAAQPTPPYVYLTGGEPLLLGDDVYGDDGLIAFAAGLGCAVNVNTNAALITPRVAVQLVKVGLARLHISVDAADDATQADLLRGGDRVDALWRGMRNVLIARELLGANHPQIHVNCVVTRLNLFQFPALLRRILGAGPQPSGDDPTSDPAFGDFGFHLIPVGGPTNAPIRPSAEEWERFYTQTWDEAEAVWQDHQERIGVPASSRTTLEAHVPYANPYRRVSHGVSLAEYCRRAAEGVYWQGALTQRCYVAPGQAFVLPDGSQQWCGAHAIRRPAPIGSVLTSTLRGNIRANADRLSELPVAVCASCAGATCAMNQAIERNLREAAESLLAVRGKSSG